jgi:hypothetical protein
MPARQDNDQMLNKNCQHRVVGYFRIFASQITSLLRFQGFSLAVTRATREIAAPLSALRPALIELRADGNPMTLFDSKVFGVSVRSHTLF